MLNWPKGKRNTDGIWEKIWYHNVQSSTNFEILNKIDINIPNKYKHIYLECLEIYKKIDSYNILNER